MNKKELMHRFYNRNIKLSKNVASEIIDDILKLKGRVLVFGLGFDSELWFNANGCKDVWFIEENIKYIDMNPNIPRENVIYHKFENIDLYKSSRLQDEDLEKYPLPKGIEKIIGNGFDIIIIDGPTGCFPTSPGRLLATYWATKKWSHKNTIFYLDDTNRKVETLCMNKYMSDMDVKKYENGSFTIRSIRK